MRMVPDFKDRLIEGIISLASRSEQCYLAYPSSPKTGDVLLFNAFTLEALSVIHAHKSPLSQMAFNQQGTLLATASDKGTVIRVFSIPSTQLLFQFRRGTYAAKVYSLGFSADSLYLACTSNTDTIHVFKLSAALTPPRNTSPLSSAVGPYIPTRLTNLLEPARDFAYCKLPPSHSITIGSHVHTVCAIIKSVTVDKLVLVVVALSGFVFMYDVDVEHGGECVLERQYCINDFE